MPASIFCFLGPAATVQRALREIERLLEAHCIKFRLPPGDERVALDLIEAVIPVEQRHVGVATVRSGDVQLPAVDSANPMRNVEFDRAASCYGTVSRLDQRDAQRWGCGPVDVSLSVMGSGARRL